MIDSEIKNGVTLGDNAVLYKVKVLTKTNPRINCIWSEFLYNNVGELKPACKLSPISKTNYITTINENDLFPITVIKPMTFWETCEKNERKYQINSTINNFRSKTKLYDQNRRFHNKIA